MPLPILFRRPLDTLSEWRRQRRNIHSLAHLDAHLLKDIGLRVEHGIVRPLYPENDVAHESVKALPRAEPAEPRTASCNDAPTLCPRCGASLA